MEENRREFDRSSNPTKNITVFLYAMDMELQKLLRVISKYPQKPMLTEPFITFAGKLEKIRENAVFGCYPVDIPQIFQTRRGNGQVKVFRNTNETDSSDEDEQPAAKPANSIKQKRKKNGKDKKKQDEDSSSSSSTTNHIKKKKNKPKNNNKNGKNPNLNKNWKLPAHVRVKDLIFEDENGRKMSDIPGLEDGSQLCMMYHCLGRCNMGRRCRFLHDDPWEIGLGEAMDTWCK
jgi:hypothetical protein